MKMQFYFNSRRNERYSISEQTYSSVENPAIVGKKDIVDVDKGNKNNNKYNYNVENRAGALVKIETGQKGKCPQKA